MGGFVYCLLVQPHEAELASVLAHEWSYCQSALVEQMQETAIARGVATAAGLDRNTAVQIGGPSTTASQQSAG